MIIDVSGGKRPACAFCGKPLRIYTETMRDQPKGSVPTVFQVTDSYHPPELNGRKILKITRRRENLCDPDKEDITVWIGRYDTTMGLFCSGPCCHRFAVASYKAGYRMRPKESKR